MRKERLVRLASPSRDAFVVWGYRFGSGRKRLAIIAGMRGHEIQQVAVASRLIRELVQREPRMIPGQEILVIPAANPFSLNVGRRFWSLDSTDINGMFPGYEAGETTQRIAKALLDSLSEFEYGINLTSTHEPGQYANHVRLHRTRSDNVNDALAFGLRYLHLREPDDQESGSLNYNWPIWNTQAFSLLGGEPFQVSHRQVGELVRAVLRFMTHIGIFPGDGTGGYRTEVLSDELMKPIWTERAGLWRALRRVGDEISPGDLLGTVTDALSGKLLSTLRAQEAGRVFYRVSAPLVFQSMVSYVLC